MTRCAVLLGESRKLRPPVASSEFPICRSLQSRWAALDPHVARTRRADAKQWVQLKNSGRRPPAATFSRKGGGKICAATRLFVRPNPALAAPHGNPNRTG